MSKQTIALAYTRPADALEESEYQALVEALSESARGRGFLAEHARRSRSAETNILLTAIERIEAQVRPRPAAPDAVHDELRRVLDDLRAARARIETGGKVPKAEQLAALLDILQRRLTKLLAPAAGDQPGAQPVPEIAAPAAPPRPGGALARGAARTAPRRQRREPAAAARRRSQHGSRRRVACRRRSRPNAPRSPSRDRGRDQSGVAAGIDGRLRRRRAGRGETSNRVVQPTMPSPPSWR